MIDTLKLAYDNPDKIPQLICDNGAEGILKALIQVLTQMDEHTIDDMRVVEYAPNCYNTQRVLIADATALFQFLYNVQTASFQSWYTYFLTEDMARKAINQFQNRASELFISKNTVTDWKMVAVLLESIEQLYVQVDAPHIAELRSSLTEQIDDANRQKMKEMVPPLKELLGVKGDELAAACRRNATLIREKITSYENNPPVPYQATGIPLNFLNSTVNSTGRLSKLMVLHALLNTYTLSQQQIKHVSEIRRQTIACLTGYLNSTTFFNVANADLVKPALAFFNHELDPKILLLKLFELQENLIKADNKDLSTKIEDIIVSAYDLARLTTEREAEPLAVVRSMPN